MTDLITVYDEIMVLMDEWRMVGVVYSARLLNFLQNLISKLMKYELDKWTVKWVDN